MAYESMSFAVGYSAEYGGIQNSLFQVQKKLTKRWRNSPQVGESTT